MWRRVLAVMIFVALGGVILAVSIFRSASVRFSFDGPLGGVREQEDQRWVIDYPLPYGGRVVPGGVLWPIKAFRDRVWLYVNTDEVRKADILLLFSDKRLVMGRDLVEQGEIEMGVTVLVKSGMYLMESLEKVEEAQRKGANTCEFLGRISLSSLKHREILETIYKQIPEDGRPVVSKLIGESEDVYEKSAQLIHEMRREPVENPFR
jgi:hypothetical protein